MKLLLRVIAFLLFTSSAFADWTLIKDESLITFTSIKKNSVAEVHTFKEFAGQVLENGKAYLDIKMDSAETNIVIRNQRLNSMLFEVAKFPGARVSGVVDIKKAQALKVGESYVEELKLQFNLHGFKQDIQTSVKVVKLSDIKIQVTSYKPLIINAPDYGLSEGVEALRKIANLPSISLAVPVTFDLTFSK